MGICWSHPLQPSTIDIGKLCCSNCKLYLSCGPITLTSKGTICGRCTLLEPGTRELLLESLLEDVVFPCRFNSFDCKTRLRFNAIVEHEDVCLHVPFKCPIKLCNWHGAQHQVWGHFINQHHSKWQPFNLKIKLDTDLNGYMIYCIENVPFLLKYDYSKTSRQLTYELNYFTNASIDAFYRVHLSNDQCNEVSTYLQTLRCYRFNRPGSKALMLNLNDYIVALNNPETIQLEICISSNILSGQSSLNSNVNYNVLESLRCNECHNYLSLPVYDSAIGSLCADCSKNASSSRLSQDVELQRKISNAIIPCRWKKCSHADSGNKIRQHELNCEYYLYACPSVGCKMVLVYKQLYLHLNVFHGITLFNNKTTYKFFFNGSFLKEFVVVRNNNMIVIKHYAKNNLHTFTLKTIESLSKITAKIYFEHSHCNLKSKTYVVDSKGSFVMNRDKLPTCFRNNEKLKLVIEV
ncbi:hypothetical protein RN001_013797 [Aquatica leii]|uniref:SIAH-type domain-containing protein n=1 Tax=Aquatica leii TaxID=1421715 RepID=A0AAN7P0I7_9COLE|nr:hypothetical protein RN001_013797 [Aquatica leii]